VDTEHLIREWDNQLNAHHAARNPAQSYTRSRDAMVGLSRTEGRERQKIRVKILALLDDRARWWLENKRKGHKNLDSGLKEFIKTQPSLNDLYEKERRFKPKR